MKKIMGFLIVATIITYTPQLVLASSNKKNESQDNKEIALRYQVDESIPLPVPAPSSSENPTPLPTPSNEPSTTPTPVDTPAPTPEPRKTPKPVITPEPQSTPAQVSTPAPSSTPTDGSIGVVLGTENNPPPTPPTPNETNALVPILQQIFQSAGSKTSTKGTQTINPPALARLATSPSNFYLSQKLTNSENWLLIFIGTVLLLIGLYLSPPMLLERLKNLVFNNHLFNSSTSHVGI